MTKISRKGFLAAISLAASYTALQVQLSFATTKTHRRFVVVILRGGLDGLTAVPPIGDPDYVDLRGALAIPKASALSLDGTFGLHPSLIGFKSLYDTGELAVFHAVATKYRERSHFEAQNMLESGSAIPHQFMDGWLNRALRGLGLEDGSGALSVSASAPLILLGPARVSTWLPTSMPALDEESLAHLVVLYSRDAILAAALKQALATEAMAKSADANAAANSDGQHVRPQLSVREALCAGAGKLLASQNGPRIGVLDFNGWDTHVQQGGVNGTLSRRLAELDGALLMLKSSMAAVWQETAVLVVSEFGRTVHPNGTGGTDHGTGTVAFLFGGNVAGGKVHTDWPGLKPTALLDDRDLMPRLELTSIYRAVLSDHLSLSRLELDTAVFPSTGSTRSMTGLFRA